MLLLDSSPRPATAATATIQLLTLAMAPKRMLVSWDLHLPRAALEEWEAAGSPKDPDPDDAEGQLVLEQPAREEGPLLDMRRVMRHARKLAVHHEPACAMFQNFGGWQGFEGPSLAKAIDALSWAMPGYAVYVVGNFATALRTKSFAFREQRLISTRTIDQVKFTCQRLTAELVPDPPEPGASQAAPAPGARSTRSESCVGVHQHAPVRHRRKHRRQGGRHPAGMLLVGETWR